MISAGGNRPATMPIVTIDGQLEYRPSAGSETIWIDVAVSLSEGHYRVNWESATNPIIHGAYGRPGQGTSFTDQDYGMFWMGHDHVLYHQPLKSDIGNSNVVLEGAGDVTGGMDEMIIYHANDLFQRREPINPDDVFGTSFIIEHDAYIVTCDTGFMDQEPFGCNVWIIHIPYSMPLNDGVGEAGLLPLLNIPT